MTWGKWISHDGKGCPCRGQYVRVEWDGGEVDESVAGSGKYGGKSWDWSNVHEFERIIRYRIRQDPAMTVLRKIAASPERELEAV